MGVSKKHKLYKICWKNGMGWIRNWRLICLLEDVIKSGENPKSHIGKERDSIRVYMLME